MQRYIHGGLAAGFLLAATSAAYPADAFTSAVQSVLIRDDRVAKLDPARQAQMVACVVKVLQAAPRPQRAALAQASSVDDRETIFGSIVTANRAKLEQAITRACGHIVVNG